MGENGEKIKDYIPKHHCTSAVWGGKRSRGPINHQEKEISIQTVRVKHFGGFWKMRLFTNLGMVVGSRGIEKRVQRPKDVGIRIFHRSVDCGNSSRDKTCNKKRTGRGSPASTQLRETCKT